jgi:hypothetical protein
MKFNPLIRTHRLSSRKRSDAESVVARMYVTSEEARSRVARFTRYGMTKNGVRLMAHTFIALASAYTSAIASRPLGLRRNRNSFHSCSNCSRFTFALLGFFSMKNPSLCCEVTFCLRVTLLKSGLACLWQAKP